MVGSGRFSPNSSKCPLLLCASTFPSAQSKGLCRMLGMRVVLAPLGSGISASEGYLIATDDAIVVFSRWRDPVHKDTAIARF